MPRSLQALATSQVMTLSQNNWANAELLNGSGLLELSFEDWQKKEFAKSAMWQVSLLFRESLLFRFLKDWIIVSVGFVAVHLSLNLKPFTRLWKRNGSRRQTGRGRRDATAQLCGSPWYSADTGAGEVFKGFGGGVCWREDKQDKEKKGNARRPEI